jgi:hypothetical protein
VTLPLKLVGHSGWPTADVTPGAIPAMESAIAAITPPRFIKDFLVLAIFHMLKFYLSYVLIVQGENI